MVLVPTAVHESFITSHECVQFLGLGGGGGVGCIVWHFSLQIVVLSPCLGTLNFIIYNTHHAKGARSRCFR